MNQSSFVCKEANRLLKGIIIKGIIPKKEGTDESNSRRYQDQI